MVTDPWKDPDSQLADFDAELDQAQVEIYRGNPNAELSILPSRRASRATEMGPCCVAPAPMEATPPSR